MVALRQRTSSRKVVRGTVYTYTVLFEPSVEGGYTVMVPMLPGVITEGNTLGEARGRVKEAIRGYLKVLRKYGQAIPVETRTQIRPPITERVVVTV
jgi:antitoxin HicB